MHIHSLPIKHCSEENYYECLDIVAEPANKATMIVTYEMMNSLHNSAYRHGTSSIVILKETIFTTLQAIAFRPYSYCFETFNEKIDHMLSTGLIGRWEKEHDFDHDTKRVSQEIGAQVLTFDHLMICFQIFLAFLSLSLIAFIGEHLYTNGKQAAKSCLGMILSLFMYKALAQVKRNA